MPLRIQYASDLHLEFEQNRTWLAEHPLAVAGDVLVLAGDIAYLGTAEHDRFEFWDWAAENYSQVILCPGNHEFYNFYNLAGLKDGDRLYVRPNVFYIFNDIVTIGNVDLIVSPMWSNVPGQHIREVENFLTDFSRVVYGDRFVKAKDYNELHRHCLSFVKQAVANSSAEHKVVVSHHAPSFQLSDPQYLKQGTAYAFNFEASEYIENSSIDAWIYGHTHSNIDRTIGRTMCVCNQLGYTFRGEQRGFDTVRMIELA